MSDICLLLEGTFPYVSGGVSTWIYDLVRKMPDRTFSLVFLGAKEPAIKHIHYPIPENVIHIHEYYLFEYDFKKEPRTGSKEDYEIMQQFLISLKKGDSSYFEKFADLFGFEKDQGISIYDFVYSYKAWKVLEAIYQLESTYPSFIDYFWTWRFTLVPFFSLLQYRLPEAKIYHAVSTGYAGVLGAMSKVQHNRPLLLTEHGIYTRERKIEISQADWIYSEATKEIRVLEEQEEFFKKWWVELFSYFSRLIYDRAEAIVTLYEGNKQVQISENADPEKISIIPNGIDLSKFRIRDINRQPKEFVVAFIGRVVPIKDLKTFIRSCAIVLMHYKFVRFEIVGPTDEDEEYFHECQLLIEKENLQNEIIFKGKQEMTSYYQQIDLVVLTSVSEAQPLVILEAGACGIPIVASDVGACRELLYGKDAEDQLIGLGGLITPVCNPEATAKAILDILKKPGLYQTMSLAIRKRVETYYAENDLIANYQRLYSLYSEETKWQE